MLCSCLRSHCSPELQFRVAVCLIYTPMVKTKIHPISWQPWCWLTPWDERCAEQWTALPRSLSLQGKFKQTPTSTPKCRGGCRPQLPPLYQLFSDNKANLYLVLRHDDEWWWWMCQGIYIYSGPIISKLRRLKE